MNEILILAFIFLGSYIYFLPTLRAYKRKHKQKSAIFIVNLFLGITVIGWVTAFVWASLEE